MNTVHVIGLGMDPHCLPESYIKIIAEAQVLVGGSRLLGFFEAHPAEKLAVQAPLSQTLAFIKARANEGKSVVVLADGDPGFFGIGRRVVDELGGSCVTLHANITTLQAAASRLKIPWQAIKTVSLHGRKDLMPLLNALAGNDRVAVYTDPVFSPQKIAASLLEREIDAFHMYVFEDLGGKNEVFGSYTLKEVGEKRFCPLNFVILDRIRSADVALCLGLDDDDYIHRKGLITKKEVRAMGLSALALRPDHIFWDLGAGSGSMAIEASVLAYRGKIHAVEKNPERILQIRRNINRTGAFGVEVIEGMMPDCLESLPDPDRIFIGGGVGKDTRVLETAARRLKTGGRLVLHLVMMGSLNRARAYLDQLGWPVFLSQVQISRSMPLGDDIRLDSLNPVFIMCAKKPLE